MVNTKRLILLLYYCISSLLCFDDRILHMHEKDDQVEQVADLPETGVGLEGLYAFKYLEPCAHAQGTWRCSTTRTGSSTPPAGTRAQSRTSPGRRRLRWPRLLHFVNWTLCIQKRYICTLIHKYICFLQCDVTTGVEASDKKLFLCLSFKSFLEHDILKG